MVVVSIVDHSASAFRNVMQLGIAHELAPQIELKAADTFCINEIFIAVVDAAMTLCEVMGATSILIREIRKGELALRVFQVILGTMCMQVQTVNNKVVNNLTVLNVVNVAKIAAFLTGASFSLQFGMTCLDLSLRVVAIAYSE